MARSPVSPADTSLSGSSDPDMSGEGAGDDDTAERVLVTISKAADGTYTVYTGDEPDDDEGSGADLSEDDMDAGAGAAPGAAEASDEEGQHCATIGAALKATLDILNNDASSEGAPGSAEDQFAAGYNGDQSPTPSSRLGRAPSTTAPMRY